MSTYTKDPDAVLDWAFDWTSWLADNETISSHTVTVPDGLTRDSDTESSGVVTVWLSGVTAGTEYRVSCLVVTSAGRTDERTITIRCRDR